MQYLSEETVISLLTESKGPVHKLGLLLSFRITVTDTVLSENRLINNCMYPGKVEVCLFARSFRPIKTLI